MELDDKYGKNGEKWFFNPENYGRQLYRRPGSKTKKLPMAMQIEKEHNPQALFNKLDEVETASEETEIIEKLNHIYQNTACQVLPLKDALKVVEIAAPLAALSCVCRRMVRAVEETNQDEYTCLGLGVGMLKWERWPERYKGGVNFISPEEAKEWLTKWDKKGMMHCVMVYGTSEFGGPYIGGVCNCDYTVCLVMRRRLDYGIRNFLLKSHYVAMTDYDQCNGCGICVQRCQYGAIKFEVTLNRPNIDMTRCFGCGLCETGCPRGAIDLLERTNFPALREEW